MITLVLRNFIVVILLFLTFPRCQSERPSNTSDFNIVLILADDLGYSDIGCYGGEKVTPNIDQLASSGVKLISLYASPICSPSRAALLTGCYPQRVGIPSVLGYKKPEGINPKEDLLPEILKEKGYKTALFGKWHLGMREKFFPQNNGFDEFFGTMASNDTGFDMDLDSRRYGQPGLYLFDGVDTAATNPQQWNLIRQYTEKSVDFISRNKNNPFFLYLAYNAPHTPLFVNKDFAGKSQIDIYHDVLTEIDWSVGEIMNSLENNHLRNKTLVVFLSDNGPWLIFGNHGGSAFPLSGGKKQTLEGGSRVPCIMSLPGIIPESTECDELTTIMDLYPTIASLTGAIMTSNKIDGKNILPLMKEEKYVESPHDFYYYYYKESLQAIRSGRFKLQLPHVDTQAPDLNHLGYDGMRGQIRNVYRPLALFDLQKDPSEQINIANKKPEIVQKLLKMAEEARRQLGDSIEDISGQEIRECGKSVK